MALASPPLGISLDNDLQGAAPEPVPLLTEAERLEQRRNQLEWGVFAGPGGELVIPEGCILASRLLMVLAVALCFLGSWFVVGGQVFSLGMLPTLAVMFGARAHMPIWLVHLWQRTRVGAVAVAMLCVLGLSASVFVLVYVFYDIRMHDAIIAAVALPLLIVMKFAMGIYSDWRDEARSRAARDARRSRCSKMPLETVSVVDLRDQERFGGDRRNCPVCLEEFASGDQRRTLPCFHVFHPGCVDQWLQEQDACPMCRHNIWTNEVLAGEVGIG